MHARENSPPDGPAAGSAVPLALIAAVAANGVIGDRNALPWRLPDDLRRFRALTTGHAVIMGRKTWESLPGALPGRQNIVVTRDPGYAAAGAEIAATLDAALALVRLPPPAFCIGGGELYRAALPRATTLYLTEIDRDFAGDVDLSAVRPRRMARRPVASRTAATGPTRSRTASSPASGARAESPPGRDGRRRRRAAGARCPESAVYGIMPPLLPSGDAQRRDAPHPGRDGGTGRRSGLKIRR